MDLARENGTTIKRKPEEFYDNSFVNNLEKSGFFERDRRERKLPAVAVSILIARDPFGALR